LHARFALALYVLTSVLASAAEAPAPASSTILPTRNRRQTRKAAKIDSSDGAQAVTSAINGGVGAPDPTLTAGLIGLWDGVPSPLHVMLPQAEVLDDLKSIYK
jgi:hypothetical protein